MRTEVLEKLKESSRELLDFGMRNPLLNHRKKSKKQIVVVDEKSTEIYRMMVIENKKFSFVPIPENQLVEDNELFNGQYDLTSEWENILIQPEENADNRPAARHLDTKLQTSLKSGRLQTRLISIHNNARTNIEEKGVNILYLALGFLHWYESESSNEPRRAPLILIPVELYRANVKEKFKLAYAGDEITENLSLYEKMNSERHIKLPGINNYEDLNVEKYFKLVEKAIHNESRWEVKQDEIALSFFSFGKFLMYKDLDSRTWNQDSNPAGYKVISSILANNFKEPESQYDDSTHIDRVVNPGDLHLVKDSDSTQTLALLDVNAGRNLVLQGPPGTGKSQTITNIIAESIGSGKTVLFVSEKMAALEVVKKRLDENGLGDAVLELHSHKTRKKTILDEINKTLKHGRPQFNRDEVDLRTLKDVRDKLNAYCIAVNKSIANTKINFITALGKTLKLANTAHAIPDFEFEYMKNWTTEDYIIKLKLVQKLNRHLNNITPLKDNIFKHSTLNEFLPSDKNTFQKSLDNAKLISIKLIKSSQKLASKMGLEHPETSKKVEIICRAAKRAINAPHLEGVKISSGEWQLRRDDLNILIQTGRKLSKIHKKFDYFFIDNAWDENLLIVRRHFKNYENKWWRFLSSDFRNSKVILKGLCRKELPRDIKKQCLLIDVIIKAQQYQKIFNDLTPLGYELFAAQWKGRNSDWDVLHEIKNWILKLYSDVGDGRLPDSIIDFLSGTPTLDNLEKDVDEVIKTLKYHKNYISTVFNTLNWLIQTDQSGYYPIKLKNQYILFEKMKNEIDLLDDVVRYNVLIKELHNNGLDFITKKTKEWDSRKRSLVGAFQYSWYVGLVEYAFKEYPELRNFDKVEQNYNLDEFLKSDKLLFQFNRLKLARTHYERIPKLNGTGEAGIIQRELNKKRRHIPIRKLMIDAGRCVQAIKPIFMMSPMSIATYLPQGSVEFDLVVFDEASQVKPVDAFGAILRGSQTVVVGDSKQLPPTSFFDTLVDSSDEEENSVADVESILSLFLSRGAPERMLQWHYRSRNESLIAVSNYEFYDNRLLVFPSPGLNPVARGLIHEYHPDTVYDKGKSSTNIKEAEIVAKMVMQHAKEHPELTLGVVAFSVAQRDAIDLQLERLRQMNPSCENFFDESQHESFFVKNLENVQGDERDVIYISIGYGKDINGKQTMNFGPLNRDGGERRLNVLISRARMMMYVFSNFKARDVDLTRSNVRGVKALKNFLSYAENRQLESVYTTDKTPDSPFEESVISVLEKHGIPVESQVGTAGYFIDIGVKDQNHPGQYILGVECDGASYHSSRSARDRDRLRQEVLEGLGWSLYRIWSTDWYKNYNREVERLLDAVKNAQMNHNGFNDKNRNNHKESLQKKTIIERDDINSQDKNSISSNQYNIANSYIPLGNREFHELHSSELADYIDQIVKVESPIHIDLLTRRLLNAAKITRAGNRIRQAISNGIHYGTNNKMFRSNGEFLWNYDMYKSIIRDHTILINSEKKIEWLAPEEIQEALYEIIKTSFSVNISDSIAAAARLLGFNRITEQASVFFEKQISKMINDGRIQINNNILSISH